MARKNLFEVKATGKVKYVRLTKEFPQEMVKTLTPPFKAAAEYMEKEAKKLAPVDTGALRDSIRGRVIIGANAAKTKKGTGGVKVPISIDLRAETPYAGFVEYGTGQRGRNSYTVKGSAFAGFIQKPVDYRHGTKQGMKAQPYIRPAMIKGMKKMQIGRL